jgi:hypothetical protein
MDDEIDVVVLTDEEFFELTESQRKLYLEEMFFNEY